MATKPEELESYFDSDDPEYIEKKYGSPSSEKEIDLIPVFFRAMKAEKYRIAFFLLSEYEVNTFRIDHGISIKAKLAKFFKESKTLVPSMQIEMMRRFYKNKHFNDYYFKIRESLITGTTTKTTLLAEFIEKKLYLAALYHLYSCPENVNIMAPFAYEEITSVSHWSNGDLCLNTNISSSGIDHLSLCEVVMKTDKNMNKLRDILELYSLNPSKAKEEIKEIFRLECLTID